MKCLFLNVEKEVEYQEKKQAMSKIAMSFSLQMEKYVLY